MSQGPVPSDFFYLSILASQTHDSHKGCMILNHENPAGRVKKVAKSLHLVLATFVLNGFFTCAQCLE